MELQIKQVGHYKMFGKHLVQLCGHADYKPVRKFLWNQKANHFFVHTMVCKVRHEKREEFVGVYVLQMPAIVAPVKLFYERISHSLLDKLRISRFVCRLHKV